MPSILLRRGRLLIGALALILGCGVALSGLGGKLDRLVYPLRVAASVRPPSGQIVVVEMDAESVAIIRRWPWPREHYATVLDRLRNAGAASITFDVDFSSASTRSGDDAMTGALARAEGLVAMPTFGQQARLAEARTIDSLPLAAFRQHVALASVSMQPDSDGIVRRAPFGTITAGRPRPSLSSLMAHRSGSADTFFPIDFGLDHRRFPRLSFVAVERGRFDPARVRGRDVVIGATAIEMGDRYATPYWGVIPGVIIQALAADTLLSGVPVEGSGALLFALAALLSIPILLVRSSGRAAGCAVLGQAALFGAAVWLQADRHVVEPLAGAMTLVAVVGLGRMALQVVRRFDRQRCFDEATGLPNRDGMLRDLETMPPHPVMVAHIGNFADVTVLLGESAGHDLVSRIADRLQLIGHRGVYRLSDRQLAIAISDENGGFIGQVEGLRAILSQPVEVRGRRTDAALHLGLSKAEGSVADRVTGATMAAVEARSAGVFWRHAALDTDAVERRLVLMGELDHAIATGQIEIHYQPKLSLATDRIASVEALVRWRHPERGMVRPDLFIPLAEHAGRIGPLTLFVLRRVIDDLAEWGRAGVDITAAINLSALLIAEPSFSAALDQVLDAAGIPPESLIFEVTESATLTDPERAAANLRRFRDRGVAISMDDYGTGQSTLTYLRQLPLSEIKIDRSFVQHAHVNHADALMVRSTIDLAHDLGLKVVAEGIEDEGCLAFLRNAGCDLAQGYHIARPMAASDLLGWISRYRVAA